MWAEIDHFIKKENFEKMSKDTRKQAEKKTDGEISVPKVSKQFLMAYFQTDSASAEPLRRRIGASSPLTSALASKAHITRGRGPSLDSASEFCEASRSFAASEG